MSTTSGNTMKKRSKPNANGLDLCRGAINPGIRFNINCSKCSHGLCHLQNMYISHHSSQSELNHLDEGLEI